MFAYVGLDCYRTPNPSGGRPGGLARAAVPLAAASGTAANGARGMRPKGVQGLVGGGSLPLLVTLDKRIMDRTGLNN
jgi:hypothetical protein